MKKETKEKYKNNKKTINKMAISIYLAIIALKVNELNAPIKNIEWPNGYKNKTHIYAA